MNEEDCQELLEDIRALASGGQPAKDRAALLYEHGCFYLLSRLRAANAYTERGRAVILLNRLSARERFLQCGPLFRTLDSEALPYAVVKGAVLSEAIYGDCGYRASGDIDLLISRRHMDRVKSLLLGNGFIQGRVTPEGIVPFSRRELLFQSGLSHQAAPFVKATGNPLCPYVNVDINLDILWGESERKSDMEVVLSETETAVLWDIPIRKLRCEMEGIALCLHHYKDANSIYLLSQNSLRLSLFCDICFFWRRYAPHPDRLKTLCERLEVGEYVYYCLWYARRLFGGELFEPSLDILKTEKGDRLLNLYGLAGGERREWEIGFEQRLFHPDLSAWLREGFSPKDWEKLRLNSALM
ncbi:MAG: nucleotidyltransferase family protein [Clostridiales bacterium]|nr:nucleotidyltransferase family protein [Clostridiales bacterium]